MKNNIVSFRRSKNVPLTTHASLGKRNTKLVSQAQKYLSQLLHLGKGKKALIIYDQSKASIGKAFAEAARQIGATTEEYQLRQCRFSSGGLEEILAEVKKGFDVCCNFFESKGEETPSRIKLAEAQMASQARIGHSPGITEEMLETELDYVEITNKAHKIKEFLNGAEKVLITSEQGTNIEIKIEGRNWVDDITVNQGELANIPYGEIFCAPIEDGANGVIVVDGSIGDFGMVPSPLKIEVKNGRILQEDGELIGVSWKNRNFQDKAAFLERIRDKLMTDEMASIIGELGVGLTPFEVIGNLLQDEKAGKTIHIAFGENKSFGGENNSENHRDFLVMNPTILVYYADQTNLIKTLIERGALLI